MHRRAPRDRALSNSAVRDRNLSLHPGAMHDFGLLLETCEKAVPSLVGASDIAQQLRLLKRNEITQALASKLRFAVKPWHRFLIFMAGSRTERIDVSIVADCQDQTPEITGTHAGGKPAA